MAMILQFRGLPSLKTQANDSFPSAPCESKGADSNTRIVEADSAELALNPRAWSLHARIAYTVLITFIGFVVSWAGSVTSAATAPAARAFGVSETVESLATGLYFIGFGLGSLVAGPISETLGRNAIYSVALILFMAFIAASGAAPNIQAQLVFRFLAGVFGNTPLTCAGGSLSDLWTPEERVIVIPFYAVGIFDGSTLAPVVGGWVAQGAEEGRLSWRWVEWSTLLLSAVILSLVVVCLPETYQPVLLSWSNRHLGSQTGNQHYHASVEARREPFLARLAQAMKRPFTFLVHEPMIVAIALYLILIYVILFTFLNGLPSIFGGVYGWDRGLVGTSFLSILIGQHLPLALLPVTNRWMALYTAVLQKRGAADVDPPENRLWMAMIGAVALPISLFWLGWTADSAISPWSCLGAGVLFGFAAVAVYIGFYFYVIETYAAAAASGLASTTVLRYVVAGAMVAPSIPMYANLGNSWTLTIFGILSTLLAAIPFAFFWYGESLRQRSLFARQLNRS